MEPHRKTGRLILAYHARRPKIHARILLILATILVVLVMVALHAPTFRARLAFFRCESYESGGLRQVIRIGDNADGGVRSGDAVGRLGNWLTWQAAPPECWSALGIDQPTSTVCYLGTRKSLMGDEYLICVTADTTRQADGHFALEFRACAFRAEGFFSAPSLIAVTPGPSVQMSSKAIPIRVFEGHSDPLSASRFTIGLTTGSSENTLEAGVCNDGHVLWKP